MGGAVGHALHRFDIWRMLRPGGKVGGVLGVVLATPLAIYLGLAACVAIERNFGKNSASDLPMLMILLLGFTLTMDTVLGFGFGVGVTIGHLINRFVAPNASQSIA